jgi:hypothetical protein
VDTNKLEDTVNQILQSAIEKASQGAEFLKDQIPDVVQQLIHWKIASNSLTVCLSILAILASYRIATKWVDLTPDEFGFWRIPRTLAVIGGMGVSLLAALVGIDASFNLLELFFAPKVWLLEYAAHLVRH